MACPLISLERVLPLDWEEALSRANACPWSSADDLVRREARHFALLKNLFRLTSSLEASCLLAVVLSAYDAARRSLLIAGGMLHEVREQIERAQARAEVPVILSVAHAQMLLQADAAVAEAMDIGDLLGDWRGKLDDAL